MDFPYKKVLVVGCGGAGKSTLARAMGERFGLPVVHLDRLWWLPGWVERGRAEFDVLLAAELAKPAWVMDGNYSRTFARRLQYADFCLYMDIDAETCRQSVHARARQYAGRTRPDMTAGCPERIDPEFAKWIENFNTNTRPVMLKTLEDSGVPYKLFTAREAAYAWLDGFDVKLYPDTPRL